MYLNRTDFLRKLTWLQLCAGLRLVEAAADPERPAQGEVHRGEEGERPARREDPAATEQAQHRGQSYKIYTFVFNFGFHHQNLESYQLVVL